MMVDKNVGRNGQATARRSPICNYVGLGLLVLASSMLAGCSPNSFADVHECVQRTQPYGRVSLVPNPLQQRMINACLEGKRFQHEAEANAANRQAALNAELAPLLPGANAGDLQAMVEVSAVYDRYGLNSNKLEWLNRAALAGSATAAMQLAGLYITQNPDQALKWYDIAANAGDPDGARAAEAIRRRQQEERDREAQAKQEAELKKQAEAAKERQQREAVLQKARQAEANIPDPNQALAAFNYLKQQMTISTSLLGNPEPGLASLRSVEGTLCRLRCGFHLATGLGNGGVQDTEIEFNLSDINTDTIKYRKDGLGRAIISFGTSDGTNRFWRHDREIDMKQTALSEWAKWEGADTGICRAKPDEDSLDRTMRALAYLAESCGAKQSPF